MFAKQSLQALIEAFYDSSTTFTAAQMPGGATDRPSEAANRPCRGLRERLEADV